MITFREFTEDVWYHGSPVQFQSFQLGKYKKDQQLGFGIHFAKERKFAELYGQYIYTCKLAPAKLLDNTQIHDVGSEACTFGKELYKRTRYRFITSDGKCAFGLDVVPPKRAFELLTKYGYDAVLYDAKYGSRAVRGMSVSNRSLAMTVLDSNKISIVDITVDERK